MPAYNDAVASSPESSSVTSGARVRKYATKSTVAVTTNASQSIGRNNGGTRRGAAGTGAGFTGWFFMLVVFRFFIFDVGSTAFRTGESTY
jgi:hypothetical protein